MARMTRKVMRGMLRVSQMWMSLGRSITRLVMNEKIFANLNNRCYKFIIEMMIF